MQAPRAPSVTASRDTSLPEGGPKRALPSPEGSRKCFGFASPFFFVYLRRRGTFHTQADNKSRPVRSESVRGGGNVLFLYGTTTVFSFSVFRRDSFLRRIRDFCREARKTSALHRRFSSLICGDGGDVSHAGGQQKPPGRSESVRGGGNVLFLRISARFISPPHQGLLPGRRRCLFLCGAARVAGRCPRHTGAVHFSVGSGAFAGAGGVFGAATWDLRRRSFRPYHRIVSTSRTPQKT